MSNWESRFEQRPVGTSLLMVTGILLFILVLTWGIVAATFGLRVATAGIVGAGEARIQIQSADFRIAAYNHFFNACSGIQGIEGSLDASLAQLAIAPESDKSRVQSNVFGLQSARAQAIAQYNADARKDYTEGQFRDSDLPYQLNTAAYAGAKTSCGTK